MIIPKLFLPGDFEDAFLYMGRLIVLTEEHTIRSYNLQMIVDSIEEKMRGQVPVPSYMFAHNEWIYESPFQSIMRNDGVSNAFLRALAQFPEPYLELDERLLRLSEHELGIEARTLLDMNIYNRRLYIAADTGLYHIDLDWEDEQIHAADNAVKKLDVRCIGTSAKYGAVSASCMDQGLFVSIDDFGWNKNWFPVGNFSSGEMIQLAEKSIRTSWSGFHLINYSTATTPVLMRSSRHRSDRQISFERERNIITEIGSETIDLDYILEHVEEIYGFDSTAIQYTFNSNGTFIIYTDDGQFYSLEIDRLYRGQPRLRSAKAFTGTINEVLSTTVALD